MGVSPIFDKTLPAPGKRFRAAAGASIDRAMRHLVSHIALDAKVKILSLAKPLAWL
jgi:hypothetical protein